MTRSDAGQVALLGFIARQQKEAVEEADGLSLRETTDNDLIAVISEDFDPEDPVESLTNIHEALVKLARKASIVPVKVGTVVPEGPISADLQKVRGLLGRIAGRVEVRISGDYDVDRLLDTLSDRVPDAKVRSGGDRVVLGQIIAREVDHLRHRDVGRIESQIAPFAADRRVRPTNETKLCDISALVARDQVENLDKALKSLVEKEMPYAKFRVIAPLPAYSFTD